MPGNDVRPATASASVVAVVVVVVAVVVTAVRRARIFKKAPARALYRTHRVASPSTYIHYYARRTHTRRARTRNGLGGGKSGAPELLGGRSALVSRGGRGTFLINICTGLVSRYLFRFIRHASAGTRAYIIIGGGVLIGRPPPELFARRSLTRPLHTTTTAHEDALSGRL